MWKRLRHLHLASLSASLLHILCCSYQQNQWSMSLSSNSSSKQPSRISHRKLDATVDDEHLIGRSSVDPTAASPSEAADQYLHPFSLRLTDFGVSGGGRGIQSLIDRDEGNVLLKISLDDTITSATEISFLGSDDDQKTLKLMLDHADGEEERLALHLLWKKCRLKDPYVVDVLPKHVSAIWTLPEDIWQQLASKCLPRCYKESFQATRDRVFDFCRRITDLQSQVSSNESNISSDISWNDCLWAFSMARSRSVAVPELKPAENTVVDSNDNRKAVVTPVPLGLIPGLDLFNHAFGSRTHIELVSDDYEDQSSSRSWVISSTESIHKGDQVYLSYGDDKDNWKLLLTYGFAASDNPNSLAFWSWQDLLEAANRARPAVFQDRVISQLMNHPQLQPYTVLSEKRATFSFDARRAQRRESLTIALTTLSSFVTQLGYQHDDALIEDVFRELLSQRIKDLEYSREALSTLVDASANGGTTSVDWVPFLDAVLVTVELEAADLKSQDFALRLM